MVSNQNLRILKISSMKSFITWNGRAITSFFKYLKILLLTVITVSACMTPTIEARLLSKNRKTAFMQGNILIGALVSVHHLPKQETASLLECGEIREQYGIQRVEAAFLAVDRINADTTLLPNITLGIEIRDSCWYPSIALEQSIEFIRDAITGPEGGNNTSPPAYCSPKGVKIPSPSSKNLVGVIGPGSSAVTIQVQNLLQLFRIPQVGYSATSKDLSDKSRFSYFLRVVPSDYYQAQVMVDIVKHYNWTFVSAVYTDGNYGQSGITAFREVAENNNICIAEEDTVLSNAEDEEFNEVIRRLSENDRVNVVVCFCEGMTVRNLLNATIRQNKTRRFLFIGSDGWADRSDVVVGLEEAAIGGLSVRIQSNYVTGFDEYYFSLRPDTNTRNPWFKEFWEHRFNCTLRNENDTYMNSSLDPTETKRPPDGTPYCTGNEKLSEGYKQDTKMAFIVKATYTMAHGLHAMHRDLCGGKPGLCGAMSPINGSLLRDYLMNVTFTYLNETVTFDSRGDPPGRYDIMNFQKLANGSYDYVKVGTWDNGTLTVNESLVVFNGSDKTPPVSVCSMPCAQGQFKGYIETGDDLQTCCWNCYDCEEEEYLAEETKCSTCHKDYWPNANKSGCDPIPVQYNDWDNDESIAALTIAALGFFATCFVMLVFIKYNHTPVVKASTRELSYIIFMGMMVSYSSSLPLLHIPTKATCAFSRILPGFSFSMIYAALVTKTNRIARILAGNKKIMTRKLRFMSATAQVVITCCLISIELGIILFLFIHQPPDAIKSYPKLGKVVLVCNTTPIAIIAPMGWDFFLILLCTVYAVKTRNLPENFNEAKFIGFSMYTTCVIWLAWMAIYFGSDHKVICMSVCTSLSALVTLVLLFFPKIYIILCKPEKNDRSAFKTTTMVRCHIGSTIKNKSPSSHHDRNPLSLVESPSCASSVYTSAESRWSNIITRIRGVSSQNQTPKIYECHPQKSRSSGSMKEHPPKSLLKRETSTWSDVSISAGQTSVIQRRDFLLQKAYGSQLDLTGEGEGGRWNNEEKGTQTSDDLLDPLIPRMRRRVTMAVREGTLSRPEGREFFDLTQDLLNTKASDGTSILSTDEEDDESDLKDVPLQSKKKNLKNHFKYYLQNILNNFTYEKENRKLPIINFDKLNSENDPGTNSHVRSSSSTIDLGAKSFLDRKNNYTFDVNDTPVSESMQAMEAMKATYKKGGSSNLNNENVKLNNSNKHLFYLTYKLKENRERPETLMEPVDVSQVHLNLNNNQNDNKKNKHNKIEVNLIQKLLKKKTHLGTKRQLERRNRKRTIIVKKIYQSLRNRKPSSGTSKNVSHLYNYIPNPYLNQLLNNKENIDIFNKQKKTSNTILKLHQQSTIKSSLNVENYNNNSFKNGILPENCNSYINKPTSRTTSPLNENFVLFSQIKVENSLPKENLYKEGTNNGKDLGPTCINTTTESEREISADESFSTIKDFFFQNNMSFLPLSRKPKYL